MSQSGSISEAEPDAALLGDARPSARRPWRRGRRWSFLSGWPRATAAAAAVAACLLAGFVIAGTGDGSRSYQATVDPAMVQGASAELRVEGDEATLVAEGLPEPEGSYQVWIKRPGISEPEPSVLFLPRDGSATAAVPGAEGAEAVLVTFEPKDGSDEPSSPPALTVPL
jgi:Anti-sigma-K factor rskA